MEVAELVARLGEPDTLEALRHGWEQSEATLPAGVPSLLDPAEITASRAYAGLPQSLDPLLHAVAAQIREEPALLHLAWHTWRVLSGPEEGRQFHGWPCLERTLGDDRGVFYLLMELAAVPRIRDVHRQMGVPEAVTRDTCRVVACQNGNYARLHAGRPGILRKELYWIRNHLTGRLFRLGRFEYMLQPFSGALIAFSHRSTRCVVALATDGMWFDREGYASSEPRASEGSWQARLSVDEARITGHPIAPHGVALRRRVALPAPEWKRVVEPGQTVLDMHIPEGGHMTLERACDSLFQAFEFFATFFPSRPAEAVQCHSWIFGPQLEAILPPSANLVRLMREVYLFPARHAPNEGLYYIFGSDDVDPATAPRETSLQRAVLAFLEGGGVWRCGGMFLLKEDLEHFGSQVYRAGWPVLLEALPSAASA